MVFSESLLHFIWRFRLFNQRELTTTTGELITIEDVGHYNEDAGPNFELARIRIGDTLWSGQVEIHIKEDDWNTHHHQHDRRFDTTILHVVWEPTKREVKRSDGTSIATLVLKDRVDPTLLERYEWLMNNLGQIPCEKQLSSVREMTVKTCLSRMTIGRLEQKIERIEEILEKTNYDWEETFLIVLGRSFGMKVNAPSFEFLGTQLDVNLIHKYRDQALKIESLLFGMAGFLKEVEDEYSKDLQQEYHYLRQLHKLEEMDTESWRFMRMRPYNFPTFRLGQLSALLCKQSYWFQSLLDIEKLDDLYRTIEGANMNPYWANHYRFGKFTNEHSTAWSKTFQYHLAINCFIPMLFAYGSYMKIESYKAKALDWLYEIPAESNQIVSLFATHNIKCTSAAESQALLYLKKEFCDKKQCLLCTIGLSILKS